MVLLCLKIKGESFAKHSATAAGDRSGDWALWVDRLHGGLVGPGGLLPLDLSRLHEGEGLCSATAWSAQSCCVPVRRVTEDNAGLLCAPAPPFSRTGWSLGEN